MSEHEPRSWNGDLPEVAPAYDLRTGQPLPENDEDLGIWSPAQPAPPPQRAAAPAPEPPTDPAAWNWHAPTPPMAAASSAEQRPPRRSRGLWLIALAGLLVLAIGLGVGVLVAGRSDSPTTGAGQPSPGEVSRSGPQPGDQPGSGVSTSASRPVAQGHFLNKRAQPDPNLPTLGQVFGGESIGIVCQLLGPTVRDPSGISSNVWDRLTDGTYVTDLFVGTDKAGSLGFDSSIPTCR